MSGDEVVGVLGQLVGGEAARPSLQGRGGNEQQHHTADDLQQTVESFERDADPEGAVEHSWLTTGRGRTVVVVHGARG